MVTVTPLAIVIGPALIPLVPDGIVVLAEIVVLLVLMMLFNPTYGAST
jgi:hypothetical protein